MGREAGGRRGGKGLFFFSVDVLESLLQVFELYRHDFMDSNKKLRVDTAVSLLLANTETTSLQMAVERLLFQMVWFGVLSKCIM